MEAPNKKQKIGNNSKENSTPEGNTSGTATDSHKDEEEVLLMAEAQLTFQTLYNADNFVLDEAILDQLQLICCVCTCVKHQAKSMPCGHVLCGPCIAKLLLAPAAAGGCKCPLCLKPFTAQEVTKSQLMRSQVGSLHMKCNPRLLSALALSSSSLSSLSSSSSSSSSSPSPSSSVVPQITILASIAKMSNSELRSGLNALKAPTSAKLKKELQWRLTEAKIYGIQKSCEWKGEVSSFLNHRRTCPRNLCCPLSASGCSSRVKASELPKHLENDCTAIVSCPGAKMCTAEKLLYKAPKTFARHEQYHHRLFHHAAMVPHPAVEAGQHVESLVLGRLSQYKPGKWYYFDLRHRNSALWGDKPSWSFGLQAHKDGTFGLWLGCFKTNDEFVRGMNTTFTITVQSFGKSIDPTTCKLIVLDKLANTANSNMAFSTANERKWVGWGSRKIPTEEIIRVVVIWSYVPHTAQVVNPDSAIVADARVET